MASTSIELICSNIMALPCEVLVDILSRLSLKQVHQLQTVSKLWFRTLSSPHFRILYNTKSMSRSPALVVKDCSFIYNFKNGIGDLKRTIIVSTMDLAGDFEIQNQFGFQIFGLEHSSSFISFNLIIVKQKVCIPTTGEIRELPDLSLPSYSFDVGYVPSINSYKIVHLFGTKPSPSYSCNKTGEVMEFGFETLTLTDGGPIPSSWRSLTHREWFSYKVDATCVNGRVIYWLVGNGDKKELRIIAMEIENEEFLTIGCPKEDNDHKLFERGQLADLNGSLCFGYYSNDLSMVSLYLLKNPMNQTWVKKCNIKLPGRPDRFKILGYIRLEGSKGDIIIGSHSLLYYLEEKSYRRIPITSLARFCIGLYFDRCFTLESTRLPWL